MNLFGKPKDGKPKGLSPEQAQAAQNATKVAMESIESTLSMLEKNERLLNVRMDDCKKNAIAKRAKKDDKGALFDMRRLKTLEKELTKIYDQKMHLSTQSDMLRSTQTTQIVINTQKTVNATMKMLSKGMDRDEVEDIMTENEDLQLQQEEIGELFAQAGPTEEESADLLNELDAMMNEGSSAVSSSAAPSHAGMSSAPTSNVFLNLPSAPKGSTLAMAGGGQAAQQANDDQDEELRALQADMGF